MLSVRVDPELLAWVEAYADARGTSRSAVVKAALREFRALARSGVPDIEEEFPARDGRTTTDRRSAASSGRVQRSGGPSSPGSAPPVVSRPAAGGAPALAVTREELMRRRQENLEKQRGRR